MFFPSFENTMPVRILCTIWAHVYSVFESRSALFPTIRVFVFMFLVGCVLSVLRSRISADVEKLTREKELDARDRQAWHQETRGCREPMSAVRKCHAGSIVRARARAHVYKYHRRRCAAPGQVHEKEVFEMASPQPVGGYRGFLVK
jgi:hypothetical protein